MLFCSISKNNHTHQIEVEHREVKDF